MAVEITRAYARWPSRKWPMTSKPFIVFCSIQGKIALWANLSKFFNGTRLCHFGSKENSIICFLQNFSECNMGYHHFIL